MRILEVKRNGREEEIAFEVPRGGAAARGRLRREIDPEGENLPAAAFLRSSLLRQGDFAAFLRLPAGERGAALDGLTGTELWGELTALSCRKYLGLTGTAQNPSPAGPETRDELARALDELGSLEALLDRRAVDARRREALRLSEEEVRDLDRRRGDWERNSALFAPLKQRLERGRGALELWDDYASLRGLRQQYEQDRLDQLTLRENIASARADLQSAEDAFALMEAEFRDRLTAQKHLVETAQTVQELDRQLQERQDAAGELQGRLEDADRELRESAARVEGEQTGLERVGLALREARKYLQTHAIDERLTVGLSGIQKCFGLFSEAKERRAALKDEYARAIQKKQQAQEALNDRQAMFSDVSHHFGVAEKEHEKAQAFFESALKGKSLSEWRGVCAQTVQRLEELEDLARKFAAEGELRDRTRTLQERRRRAQQEARDLNIRDVAQTGKIEALQDEVQKLERRVSLLRRIEDLDAMRELLQDGVPCPLCGAATHPYVSGGSIPDEAQTHDQLQEAQRALDALNDELSARRARAGLLSEELAAIDREEEGARQELSSLSAVIGAAASDLGLKFGAGVPPLEELDRVRQKLRDQLQRARGTLDVAEAAEHDLKAAADELERVRESRVELTRYHQEALFQLQTERAEEERLEAETRSQEESFNAIRRELVSLLSLYGYKNIPDENPGAVIEALEGRSAEWREQSRNKEALERDLAVAQSSMTALKKGLDALRLNRGELAGQLKTVEAERDSLRQQRIILFADRDPQAEKERMERDVEDLRRQLQARREAKAENANRLQEALNAMHDLETEMATRREQAQRDGIAFGKRLLASGFKNEDDFLSACLSDEERRDLQARLRDLTQEDLEIAAARENAQALQMRLQQQEGSPAPLGDREKFLRRLLDLNRRAGELYLSLAGDGEAERLYRGFAAGLRPRLADLGLDGDEASRTEARGLIWGSILDRANARLAGAGDLGSDGALGVTGGADPELAALALAWGLADLFDGRTPTRFLDAGAKIDGLASDLHRDGERVLPIEEALDD